MSVSLIDMGQEVGYVDVNTAKVPYKFSVKLIDRTYTFTIKYNDQGGFFTVDLETTQGEVLAFGDIVRYGRQLFGSIEDDRFPLPVIIPRAFSPGVDEITFDNFGKEVKLYLYERRAA